MRNAVVTVSGTDISAVAEAGGIYRLQRVPAGEVRLVATFSGLDRATATVTVNAGRTVVQDFELTSSSDRSDVTKLGTFVVSAEREGNAKAIQNQRNAVNIVNSVASDVFGDVPEGNVGEFLKYLPGVEIENIEADARGVRLRGMDPQYVGMSLDGIKIASADAFNFTIGTSNAGQDGSRAFGFESVSLSSVESIEVHKTLRADMPADAPAGTINLRSKRAFDRKGRRISWQLTATGNSYQLNLNRTPGPGDDGHYKIRGGGILEYSDQLMDQRLGIVLNLTRSDMFNEQYWMIMNLERPAGSNLIIPRRIQYVDSPKTSVRTTGTITMDFKASPELTFGVTSILSEYVATNDQRQAFFQFASNATTALNTAVISGVDPLLSVRSSGNNGASLSLNGGAFIKTTNGVTISPFVEYRPTPNLQIDGRLSYSRSNNHYVGIYRGMANDGNVNSLTAAQGLVLEAERSSLMSADWTFTQLAGPDWADLSNFMNPRITDQRRQDIRTVTAGMFDISYRPGWKWLSLIKTGLRSQEEIFSFSDQRQWWNWSYNGPGGGPTGSWAEYGSTNPFEVGDLGATFPSISGSAPVFPGKTRVASLFNSNPEYFTFTGTPVQYFNSFIGSRRYLIERVDSGYLMGATRFKNLRVQAGVRYEDTIDKNRTFQQRTRDEVAAAGFATRVQNPNGTVSYFLPGTTTNAFNAQGRHVQVPGLQYQFESLPRKWVKKSYDHLFPSASASYEITPNLTAQFGYHEAISRPPLTKISGLISIEETTERIFAPNTGLLPEESKNYMARLAYYFEPVGTFSVAVFQSHIENLRVDLDLTGPEAIEAIEAIGLDPAEFPNYRVRTTINDPAARRFRGLELGYSQSLSFLPQPFKGLGVFANYTRNYASVRRGGLMPHQISGGIGYNYKRFGFNTKFIWTDDTPWTQNIVKQEFRESVVKYDLGLSYRLTDRLTLALSGRNVTNEPIRRYEQRPGEPKFLFMENSHGAFWSASIKGTF